MSSILIIGGYGGFGARLARRLLDSGHTILVAGRSGRKAAQFCEDHEAARLVTADRDKGIGMVIARTRPDLVIDAAGPFQESGYTVPEACIAMRVPYLDIADARDFVTGIGVLDDVARRAGVAVIAGASSVPGLSGAVARELSRGMDRASSVEMSISASSRAVGSLSVAMAILSYVGKPIRLWRGRRWSAGHGWQEMRRAVFEVPGSKPLRRHIALADVPDLDLLPQRLPGRPAVSFRAGTERLSEMFGLWLLSWPVRWGWLRSARGVGRWLVPLQRWMGGRGDGRSAMFVKLKGLVGGEGVERRWTLIAEDGDGPEIPILAAAILADDILAGRIEPGARDCGEALSLDRFEDYFQKLSVRWHIAERKRPALYRRLMGDRFLQLPAAVREMHEVHGDAGAIGEGEVVRGRNPLARLLGGLFSMPPEGHHPVRVAFAENDGVERWTRDFGGYVFSSELCETEGCLVERFGPIRFSFDLPSGEEGLRMALRGWSVFGIPMPRRLGPRIAAREWEDNDRFRFSVDIRAPIAGHVVTYRGWLRPAPGDVGDAQDRHIAKAA